MDNFLKNFKNLNRNIKLYLFAVLMINIGFGVIGADFNLYILSMGISPDFLGVILSLTPFAQMIAAIPIGFLAEKAGNKSTLILVNLVVGFSYLIRVISPNQTLILLGSFLIGTVQAGYFIIQMPFISQYVGEDKDFEFTLASIAFFAAIALGNLVGGFLPVMLAPLFSNETTVFRAILVGASVMVILSTIPLYFLEKDKPGDTSRISLSPYLKGIDANTVRFASIEFFLGAGLGFLLFFMNVIFVFYFKSNLQTFGTMSAIQIIPTVTFLLLAPILAKRFGGLRVVITSRVLGTIFALLTIITTNIWIGASAYVLFRSMMGISQSLWISFASSVATRRSRTATSTWLEITFQFGFAMAALGGGWLIARELYPVLGIISSSAMGISFILTYLFFGKNHLSKAAD